MIRAVLFDWYDTLAHVNGETILAGRRAMAERAGVDPERMAELWRDTAEQRMLGALGSLEEQFVVLLGRLGRAAPPALVRELAAIDARSWQEAVTLYPDARPALEALKARGYRLGVLSNCSAEAGAVIEHAGLDHVFDALALSFRLHVAKPQPAIYHAALEMLGVGATETVFVADGAFGELDAARALGIVAVLIEQAHQSRAYGASSEWDYRVERLAQVPPLVDRLGREPVEPPRPEQT
ncbi:MAG TPA: HAD family hydrolase [Chloroflexota bacterium]|nr:HAD family hydrolase [Chloroflexota bacterium]